MGNPAGQDTKRVAAGELRRELAEILNEVAYGEEEFVVVRRGKELAAIIPMRAYYFLRKAAEQIEDMIDARTVRENSEQPNYVSLEETLKGLGDA